MAEIEHTQGPRPDVELDTAPCGCRHGVAVIDGKKAFVFEPCSPKCPLARYVYAQMIEQQKDVEIRKVTR